MRKKVEVVAALIHRDGAVLLDRRKKGTHLADTWEFPGGKREAGETLSGALEREVKEELGVRGRVGELVATVEHAYESFDLTLHLFEVGIEGEPRALEVAEIRWVALGALDALPMPPADVPLVAAVKRRLSEPARSLPHPQ